MNNLGKRLYDICLKNPDNLFDAFINDCQRTYSKSAHSLVEMRLRDNKKIKGDIFEIFCVLYLKYIKGYQNVYLLKDVPQDILNKLSMKRRDMGIDLVVESDGIYHAVQCKYKIQSQKRKTGVTWRTLSTFYALCMRTGPWSKHIVMTNCDYVSHQGKKNTKDMSICLNTFRKIKREDWLKMCNIESEPINNTLSKEELRKKRLAYYIKK
jgi:hypothetical protein